MLFSRRLASTAPRSRARRYPERASAGSAWSLPRPRGLRNSGSKVAPRRSAPRPSPAPVALVKQRGEARHRCAEERHHSPAARHFSIGAPSGRRSERDCDRHSVLGRVRSQASRACQAVPLRPTPRPSEPCHPCGPSRGPPWAPARRRSSAQCPVFTR